MLWWCGGFASLGGEELYEILRLRQDVFILEQQCLYPDIDGKDPQALHLCGRRESGAALIAYARLFPPTRQRESAIVGRVLTAPHARAGGLGRKLVDEALREIAQRFGPVTVELSAQAHLERLYASFGFETVSVPYEEDGILHVDMKKDAQRST